MAADDPFTWEDMHRFHEQQFKPLLQRIDDHMSDDAHHFEALGKSLESIHTTIKVNTSVQQALTAQAVTFNERLENAGKSKLAKFGLGAAMAVPVLGLGSLVVAVMALLTSLRAFG